MLHRIVPGKPTEPVEKYFNINVFNNQFNLHFQHLPRQDISKTCDRYKHMIGIEGDKEKKLRYVILQQLAVIM